MTGRRVWGVRWHRDPNTEMGLAEDGGWCLSWGDDSPPFLDTEENARDRAGKLTATSATGTIYWAEVHPDSDLLSGAPDQGDAS